SNRGSGGETDIRLWPCPRRPSSGYGSVHSPACLQAGVRPRSSSENQSGLKTRRAVTNGHGYVTVPKRGTMTIVLEEHEAGVYPPKAAAQNLRHRPDLRW